MSSRVLQALWSGATTSPEGASGWLSLSSWGDAKGVLELDCVRDARSDIERT